MSLANILNIPASPESFDQWAFSHMAHHRDIVRLIYQDFAIAAPEYALYPFNPSDPSDEGNWEYWHQTMHNDMNAVLGIIGSNLLGANWGDQGELSVWIQLNFSEHFQANNILGIT